jgi:hypothetical protein
MIQVQLIDVHVKMVVLNAQFKIKNFRDTGTVVV